MPAPTDVTAADLGFFGRLGSFCARHGASVLITWVALATAFGISAALWGGELVNDFKIPGAGSQKAQDLLAETFPQAAGNSAQLVFAAKTGTLEDPDAQKAVQQALTSASKVEDVIAVGNPYTQQSALLNKAGTVAMVNVQFSVQSFEVSQDQISQLEDGATDAVAGTPVEVNFTGAVITNNVKADDDTSELIGIAVAVIILIVILGSVVSAVIPIVMAMIAVFVGLAFVQLEADLTNLNTITPTLATMLGLGVGIDYSLFILTRFRQALENGFEPTEAAGVAVATAGRAVAFAGVTVIISLASLAVFGLDFITVLGLGAGSAVIVAVIAANTLLPAALGLLGHRANALRMPWGRRPGAPPGDPEKAPLGRWAALIGRWRWVAAGLGLIILIVLALPVAKAQLGAADAGTYPKGETERIAYDQIATAFGPGVNGPLLIAVNQSQDPGLADRIAQAVAKEDGVASVAPPSLNQAGTTAAISVVPTTSPQSTDTSDLVDRLRDDVIPPILGDADAEAYVGGVTAAFDDIAAQVGERLPWFLLCVVGIIFLILMTAFRSLAVGVTSGVAMLLSAMATFGVLIAVFQFGWGLELVGLDKTGPIESYLPPVVFAILFGLSTDYQVFLLSRIREDVVRGEEPRRAIVLGLGQIGTVIVAAALIMTAVFFSFLLNDQRAVKEFGLSLGASILIDAFIIRLTIMPAVAHILGHRMWWLPRWLDRVLPHLDIEPPVTGGKPVPRLPDSGPEGPAGSTGTA